MAVVFIATSATGRQFNNPNYPGQRERGRLWGSPFPLASPKSNSGRTFDYTTLGGERYPSYCPERRPWGQNLALELSRPMRVFEVRCYR